MIRFPLQPQMVLIIVKLFKQLQVFKVVRESPVLGKQDMQY